MPVAVTKANLLEAASGTRFDVPRWFDLEALRVFIAGPDSSDDEGEE